MCGEELPFVGRIKQLEIIIETISKEKSDCVTIYSSPGIGKTRLLAEIQKNVLKEDSNVISFSLNNFDDEISFLYQIGNNLQQIFSSYKKKSQLYMYFKQQSTINKSKSQDLTLNAASIIGGFISPPVGISLSITALIKTLKDLTMRDEQKITFLMDLFYLLYYDLNELVNKNQKIIFLLDDGHKFTDSHIFQNLIKLILQGIPKNIFIIISSREKFQELTSIEIELLEFSESELKEILEKAFPDIDINRLKNASFGNPYIIDRLYRIKTLPNFSMEHMGIEFVMDYVDTEFIQNLSEEELEFLVQISPIEEITYESVAIATQKPHIFVRKLMQKLISHTVLCSIGRRDYISHEKIYKIQEIFRPALYRSLDNSNKIHELLANFYSGKMKQTKLLSHEAYYLRLCLIHLRQSSIEEFVRIVIEKSGEGEIFDLLGRYKEALEIITIALKMCKEIEFINYLELHKGYHLNVLGNINEAKNLFQKTIDRSNATGDQKCLLISSYEMGNILEMEGQNELALQYYENSLKISDKIDYNKLNGKILFRISIIFFDKSKYNKALDHVNHSIEFCEKTGDIEGEISSLTLKASIFIQFGSYEEAIKYAKLALEKSRLIEYIDGEGDALDTLADIQFEKGNYLKSLIYIKKQENIYRKCGNIRGVAFVLINKGRILLNFGKYSKVFDELQQALTIARNVQDIWLESLILHYIGINLLKIGNIRKANKYFKESLEISRKLKDLSGIGVSLHWMGILSLKKGNIDHAMRRFRKSIKISENLGEKTNVIKTIHWIGKIYVKQGDYNKALKIFRNNLKFYREKNNRRGIVDSIFMIGVINRKRDQLNPSFKKMKICLKIYKKMKCNLEISETLLELSKINIQMGKKEEALKTLHQALKITEKLQNHKLKLKIINEIKNCKGEIS